jgi:hypothetical protein
LPAAGFSRHTSVLLVNRRDETSACADGLAENLIFGIFANMID